MVKKNVPPKAYALYIALLDTIPEIKRRSSTATYTALNGNMFTFLDTEGKLGLRMSKEDKAAFEEKFNSPPYLQYGAVMNGYVTVPDSLFQNTSVCAHYLAQSYAFAQTLKPKPTK